MKIIYNLRNCNPSIVGCDHHLCSINFAYFDIKDIMILYYKEVLISNILAIQEIIMPHLIGHVPCLNIFVTILLIFV